MSANVLYCIRRHRVTGWVRCVGILQSNVFAPRLLADIFLLCFYAASAAYGSEMKKDAKLTAHLPLPLLKNVGECVILHSSAPGNRMGEMSWHLAGQRVGSTAARRFFLLSLLYRLLTKKSSVL